MSTKRMSAAQAIALGFALIILIGTLLLMLPISNKSGDSISFLNALFTSTSTTCVTGLVVFDTWSQFTIFGQIVILILIQIGGLGFMTFAVLFSFALKKRIGLRERTFLTNSFSSLKIGGIIKLVRRILIGTLIFELGGMILLAIRFCPYFGFWPGIWYSVFHSISAFCNAGFDLMGVLGPYSSLAPFAGDVLVNVVIMILIVVGGIGFIVWNDIISNGLRWRKYSLHTKVILSTTFILIIGSAMVFLITEGNASMIGMSSSNKVLASFFQAITSRTAGFNTINVSTLSNTGTLLTIILMFIGAGPGSAAGGIKISTFAVMILAVISYMRGKEDVDVFQRRIEPQIVRRAFTSTVFYFVLAMCGVAIISSVELFPLKDVFFEVFSALGTVGLSMGITSSLGIVSKVVIIILMYSGRISSLTLIIAVAKNRRKILLRNPVDKVIIG